MVRYFDDQEKELLPDVVGRCDREQTCGYHYTPSQFFSDNPDYKNQISDEWKRPTIKLKQRPIDLIDKDVVKKTLARYDVNNFVSYLSSIFNQDLTSSLIDLYKIGTSSRWMGSTVFWQIDSGLRPRQAKVMLYNQITGRRVKDGGPKIFFAGKSILKNKDANLKQCFFGEHLLPEFPDKVVAVVESEKTAIIASAIYPKFLWIATGGLNGCRWTDVVVFSVLKDRRVILFPDMGCYSDKVNEKTNKVTIGWNSHAEKLRACGFNVTASSKLELKATEAQKAKGYDLADVCIKRDEIAGWALSENKYPIFWDRV